MQSQTPHLTAEARTAALERSIEARRKRAAFKKLIDEGRYSTKEALSIARSDKALAKMRVIDFICAHRGYGRLKARELMKQLSIAESRRIGGLGVNQREALIKALPF